MKFYLRVFISAVLLLLATASTVKQQSSFSQGEVVPITSPSAGNVELATWAYAHPADGNHLMACGMIANPDGNVFGYVYSSNDAGITWHRTMLENSTRFMSEENCSYDADGIAYFVAGASNFYNGLPHHETGHLHIYRSNDYGTTWRRIFTRAQGWIDWTYLADIPGVKGSPSTLAIFGNVGTDRLGHWYGTDHLGHGNRISPVVIWSSDGHAFSGLVAPQGERYRFLYAFASGSVALRDGTALFAVTGNRTVVNGKHTPLARARSAVEIFSYAPKIRVLKLRSTLAEYEKTRYLFVVSLAQDQSGGPFDGRLYAAWTVASPKNGKGNASSIWLSTSDDRGIHWSSRTLLKSEGIWTPSLCQSKSIFDAVHLAVSRDGTLGILWSENDRDLLFGSSRDGGQTLTPSVLVAAYKHPFDMRIVEALPTDDYWQATVLDLQTGKPAAQSDSRWETSPGLALVMMSGSLASAQNSLAVDAHGVFHAFWSLPREDNGRIALFTRAINAYTYRGIKQSTLNDPTRPSSCMFLTEDQVHPALPQPATILKTPFDQREVTSSVAINPLHYYYDATSHTMSVDAELVNVGKAILKGPLTLVGTNLHSDFGTPVALNAQGKLSGQPMWYFDRILPTGALVSGAHSKLMHFAFRVEEFRVPPSLEYAMGDGIAMKIRVYEPKT